MVPAKELSWLLTLHWLEMSWCHFQTGVGMGSMQRSAEQALWVSISDCQHWST